MNRENRIDIVRGIAMLTILLNHFAMAYRAAGYQGWEIPTPTQLGYSSAASIFVALSGYMVGMVYLRRERPIPAVLKRAGQLYLVNLALFVLISPATLFADPTKDAFWNMRLLAQNPLEGVLRFLTLRDAPAFLDVLQLYVVLLAMTPVAVLLARRSRWLVAVCSLGLWALMQIWPFVMPQSVPVPSIGRGMNAFAWQMVFFLPMIAGMGRWHEPLLAFFRRHGWAVAVLLGLLVAAAILRDIDRPFVPDWRIHLALTDRALHGPVWTIHAALLISFYLGALAWATPWLHALPFRLLASMGRNSLNVYAASIPVIIALALGIGAMRLDRPGYLAGTLLTLLLIQAVALWSDRRRARRKAAMRAVAAVQPA